MFFACGDVRLSPVKRVASAVGEGSMAIAFIHKYLQQDRAVALLTCGMFQIIKAK